MMLPSGGQVRVRGSPSSPMWASSLLCAGHNAAVMEQPPCPPELRQPDQDAPEDGRDKHKVDELHSPQCGETGGFVQAFEPRIKEKVKPTTLHQRGMRALS